MDSHELGIQRYTPGALQELLILHETYCALVVQDYLTDVLCKRNYNAIIA